MLFSTYSKVEFGRHTFDFVAVVVGVLTIGILAYCFPKLYVKIVAYMQSRREQVQPNENPDNVQHQAVPPAANPGSHFSLVSSDDEDLSAPILRQGLENPRFFFSRVSFADSTLFIYSSISLSNLGEFGSPGKFCRSSSLNTKPVLGLGPLTGQNEQD